MKHGWKVSRGITWAILFILSSIVLYPMASFSQIIDDNSPIRIANLLPWLLAVFSVCMALYLLRYYFLALKYKQEIEGFHKKVKDRDDRLESANQNFINMFQAIGHPTVIMDPEHGIVAANRAVVKAAGVEEKELLGKKCYEIFHGKKMSCPPSYCPFETMRSSNHLETSEMEIEALDGVYLVSCTPVLDENGKIEKVIHIATDITENKKAENALRESEAKYRKLLSNLNEAVFITRKDRTVYFCNGAVEKILGYTPDEMMGMPTAEIYETEEQYQLAGQIHDQLRAGDTSTAYELNLRRKDGRVIPVEMSGAVYDDEHIIVIVRDITARLSAQKDREALEIQLRQSQKMEAIGHLAGGIAHDFNNLLMAILGYSDICMEKAGPVPELYSDLSEIKKAGERAAALTRQLLAFSRKQMLQLEIVDLNHLIAGINKMLCRLIGEDIDLVTVPAPDLGRIKADPAQIEQIILNLVLNARDAMPQGGKLIIETANVEVDETYAEQHAGMIPGMYVLLSISDNGAGMDRETQSKIFDPFFTTKEKGTGLGLSTVYGIVKQSEGNIYVYSEPGYGTAVKVYLKHIPYEDFEVEAKTPSSHTLQGSETILLVEDEKVVRNLIYKALQANQYTVLQASNGIDALEISKKHPEPIHILLTDIVMPQMSGRELADELKPLRPDTRVLYMSGYTDSAIVHHGRLDKGVDFLQKPFQAKVLLRKIREICERV